MKGFSKTRTPNMWRNDVSNRFYAVARAPGKKSAVPLSLKTTLETIAKLRLPAKLALIRAGGGQQSKHSLTLEECTGIYLARNHTRKGRPLKPRSKDYRSETVAMLRRTFPEFAKRQTIKITPADCEAWAHIQRANYSGTRFNGMLESLRGLFTAAIAAGACVTDPSHAIVRAQVELKKRHTSSRDNFTRLLLHLDNRPQCQFASKSVRGLAFTGLRPNEARHLNKDDIDLQRATLIARKTKNGQERIIPLIPQALELFENDLAGTIAALKKTPRRALRQACIDLKLPHMTLYDLRNMFSVRMDEAGLSIRAGAGILGHQDGGRTRLKHYLHSENNSSHVREGMKRVVV